MWASVAFSNAFAFLCGLSVSVGVISTVQSLGHRLYPIADHGGDSTRLREVIRQLPLGAFLMVELSYVLGSFTGGTVIAWLVTSHGRASAVMLGVVLTMFGAGNLIVIPHPAWFAVLSIMTFVPMALGGAVAFGAV